MSSRCRQGHTLSRKKHNVKGSLNGVSIWAEKKDPPDVRSFVVRRTMQLLSRLLIPARDNCFVCPAQGQITLRMPAGAGLCHSIFD